jgi:hypothetical protein
MILKLNLENEKYNYPIQLLMWAYDVKTEYNLLTYFFVNLLTYFFGNLKKN